MLKEIIKNYGINKTNKEIIDYLDADVVLYSDDTVYTIAQIKLVVSSLDELRLICGTIKQVADADPLVWAFSQKLFTTGISFADAETQFIIDGLGAAGKWSADTIAKLKGIGVARGKRYTQLGLVSLPNDSELNTAREKATFASWAVEAKQLLDAAINGEQTNIDTYKTLISEL